MFDYCRAMCVHCIVFCFAFCFVLFCLCFVLFCFVFGSLHFPCIFKKKRFDQPDDDIKNKKVEDAVSSSLSTQRRRGGNAGNTGSRNRNSNSNNNWNDKDCVQIQQPLVGTSTAIENAKIDKFERSKWSTKQIRKNPKKIQLNSGESEEENEPKIKADIKKMKELMIIELDIKLLSQSGRASGHFVVKISNIDKKLFPVYPVF